MFIRHFSITENKGLNRHKTSTRISLYGSLMQWNQLLFIFGEFLNHTMYPYSSLMPPPRETQINLTIRLNALKVRRLAVPKEHPPGIPSQLQLAPLTICPSRHSVDKYETTSRLSYIPQVLHIQREPSAFRQWGFLNVQTLFVHSVSTHVCQRKLLRCSIIALTGRDRKTKQKGNRAVCFLCSLSEV